MPSALPVDGQSGGREVLVAVGRGEGADETAGDTCGASGDAGLVDHDHAEAGGRQPLGRGQTDDAPADDGDVRGDDGVAHGEVPEATSSSWSRNRSRWSESAMSVARTDSMARAPASPMPWLASQSPFR